MSATGPDLEPSAEDHAYFEQLERAFLRLRGRATLLSAADWQAAAVWRRRGIPIDLVLNVMETLFARHRERKQRAISSLRYFSAAVEAAWEEVIDLQAGGRRTPPPPIRTEERLGRLSAALPGSLPERARWAARIQGAQGSLPEIEAALARWDEELLADLERGLTARERSAIEGELENSLTRLRARWTAGEIAEARVGLRKGLLRRRFGLPVLSLFAPEAEGDQGSMPPA